MLRHFSIVLIAVLFVACGEKAPAAKAGPAATFCTDGSVKCIGNVVAKCIGGKSYEISACGDKYCAGGTCLPTVCEKGSTSCKGPDLMQCPSNGSADPSLAKTCTGSCVKGACVPATCKDGDVLCGWRNVLTCKDNSWASTLCTPGQYCDAGQKKCLDKACAPDAVKCKSDSTATVCSTLGDKWLDKACVAGEACCDGVCRPLVKGEEPDASESKDTSTAADSGGTDIKPSGKDADATVEVGVTDIVLEQNDIFKVTVSEKANPPAGASAVEFELASAGWNDTLKMLQLTGASGLNKIEIQIAKLEEFQEGTFTAEGGEAPDSALLYNDGSANDPKTQWIYGAADYTITIDEFGDAGGRIKGSFSATMANAEIKDKKIYFVDGVFDIARK